MGRKKPEQTSEAVGSAASRVLRGKGTKKDIKAVAASSLTQRPARKKKKAKAKRKRTQAAR